MSATVNKLLWAGDKFIPEMHSKQTVFTYNAYGRFTKIKKEQKDLTKQEIQNTLIKTN